MSRHDDIQKAFAKRVTEHDVWQKKLRTALQAFIPLVEEKLGCFGCVFSEQEKVTCNGLFFNLTYSYGTLRHATIYACIVVERGPSVVDKEELLISWGSGSKPLNAESADRMAQSLAYKAQQVFEEAYPIPYRNW